MTTQQLIEMAVLDALALLDDDERDDFEHAFRTASPQVQAHVRREQTRLCNIESILPDVEPPAGLRAAVLAAVRDEISLDREHRRPVRSEAALALFPARRVSPLWRAAAVGLATASVVFAGTVLWMKGQVNQVERVFQELQSTELLAQIAGPEMLKAMADSSYQKVAFKPVDPSFPGSAALHLDPETGRAFLVCDQLPVHGGRTYNLVIVDGNTFQEIAGFKSNGGIQPRDEALTLTLGDGIALAITVANETTGLPEQVLTISPDVLSSL